MEENGVQFVMNILTRKMVMLCVDSSDLLVPFMLHLILSEYSILYMYLHCFIVCLTYDSLGFVRNFLHITNISCAGNEHYLWDCPFDNATEVKCNYYNQVAVHCGMLS